MKYSNIRQKVAAAVAAVVFSVLNIAQAQDIATLPSDQSVCSGLLPNGTRWYVASNPYVKGVADFAVVQMTGSETVQGLGRDAVVAYSRESLASQPLLLSPSVQDYFIRHGSVPGPEGFAEVNENTTIFRFRNVNMKLSESVLDSTLLVLTNIVGRGLRSEDQVLKDWYVPADQAIIVAGDVDAKAVAEKLRMLSYMVPSSCSRPRVEYEWVEQDSLNIELYECNVDGLVRAEASWRLQRTPKNLMNTVMPAIYAKYMTMAGIIVRERILSSFREAGVPVASVESRYVGGVGTLGDEEFSVSLETQSEHVGMALSVMAGAISSIDAHGADIREIRSAGYAFTDDLYYEDGGRDVRNSEYIDRCIYSFVYNAPLSSKKDIRNFYASKALEAGTERDILHSIVSSSLDGRKNLTLKVGVSSETVSADSLKNIFLSSWQQAEYRRDTAVHEASLLTNEIKTRVRSIRKEYLSGGSVMTMSNGIKIIYRNMPTEDGMLHYSMSLGGGAGNVEGLCSEDGGYLADFFDLCRVGGVPGKVFREKARAEGMTIKCNVSHSDTEFCGMVPEDRLDYLFSVLLTMMNARQVDLDEWEYYYKGEQLRQLAGCASGHKGCLTDKFPERADKFFRTLAGKVNDGIIVLVGEIDERKLKEVAAAYAGGFGTSERAFERTETYNGPMSGRSGEYRKGNAGNVEIHLSAPMPLTAENFYASAMAAMVLRRNLTEASAGMGVRVDVSHECRRHPQEILSLTISLEEAAMEGFASGTLGYCGKDAMTAIREVVSDLSGMQIDEDVLASYRYRLDRHLNIEKETPEYWMHAIRLRYMEGKDFTTGASAKINSLSADSVKKILSLLDKGTKVEYTITER